MTMQLPRKKDFFGDLFFWDLHLLPATKLSDLKPEADLPMISQNRRSEGSKQSLNWKRKSRGICAAVWAERPLSKNQKDGPQNSTFD